MLPIWTTLEPALGITCASMPALSPLLKKIPSVRRTLTRALMTQQLAVSLGNPPLSTKKPNGEVGAMESDSEAMDRH